MVQQSILSNLLIQCISTARLQRARKTTAASFKEAAELVFNYSTDWQTGSLQYPIKIEDEEGTLKTEYRDIELYFKGGVTYTVRFQVTLGAIGRIVRQLNESLLSINNDYLSILKLTGANPDPYRDYGFYRIMPDTIIDLKVQALVLEKIADELASTAGVKSTNVATLPNSSRLLSYERFEDQVARNLSNPEQLSRNAGYATQQRQDPAAAA